MTAVNKIDSNVTSLRYAEEDSLKTLPGSPEWIGLEPNSYKDFGGNIATIARNPISGDRQKKKGVTSDLDAAGGFTNDLTQTNLQDILQGFMFADLRRKGEELVNSVDVDTTNPDEYLVTSTSGFLVNSIINASGFTNSANNGVDIVTAITSNTAVKVATGHLTDEVSPPADAKIVNVGYQFASATLDVDITTGDLPRLKRHSGSVDFTTLGLTPGEWIFVGGDDAGTKFVTAANNGFKRVRSVAATYIEVDKSLAAMSNETGTGLTVNCYFGRVLKNETGSSIIRRSYQLERTLGASDDAQPTEIQAEYIVGAVPNEMVLNINTADKITADLSFMACDHEVVDGATGVKAGTRPTLLEEAPFNSSSDFSRIKMSTVSATDEAPTALFAFVTEMKLTVKNNISANKAIGTLGAFDLTAGTFEVAGSVKAYFSDIAAIDAVRSNADITLDMIMVKDNKGIALDLPLISLSDGRATVEQDQPITLPLTHEAASGESVSSGLNHTLCFTFFDLLPNAADL